MSSCKLVACFGKNRNACGFPSGNRFHDLFAGGRECIVSDPAKRGEKGGDLISLPNYPGKKFLTASRTQRMRDAVTPSRKIGRTFLRGI